MRVSATNDSSNQGRCWEAPARTPVSIADAEDCVISPALRCTAPPRPAGQRAIKDSLRQVEARRQHQPTSWPFCPPPVFPRQSSKLPRPFQLIDELDRPPSPSPSPSPFWPSTDPSPIHPPILIFCPSLNLRPPSHPASEHHLDAGCSRFALPIAISTALWRPETYSPISNLIESESYLLGISPATRSATVLQL